ncbi:MBG domain-containing protein [Levilactobacillus tongjiangensis]|uniref:MBG domain-containing protein n=1 Tax=Levilactobacillus tongjiangensis TaxID=2486023 RepID=A0ABW1SPK1_9LACO|nr:MBG domain-containing protein [Levilactobacillus tongjiangensis]
MATQAFSVPVAQAFTAKVTPVDSVTKEPIPGMDPIQVTTVAGKSVVVQVPGYTPVTVTLAAPTAGKTVANDTVLINTSTTPSTATDVANPINHYYTATGETIDGTPVTANVTVGTNQSVTDALNATPIGEDGKAITDGSTPAYTWSTVPNAAGTDSTDSTTLQDSKSILVPTKSTLDKWIQQATDNQTKADTEKAAAQDIYDKFVASPDITADQKTAAKSLLDSVNAVYENLSKTNADAKASLEDAENSTDPATIVTDSQAGYAGISGMDTSLSEFKNDVDNMSTTNAATQASMVSFKSWSQDYGTPLKNPEAVFGDGFGVTVSADQLAGLFADPNNFYYVDALASDTPVTPKNVGTYYFKLTDAGRSYIKSLTPDNPNAGLYVSGTVTINPVAVAPTIQDTSVVYGAEPTIVGSLGSKLANTDDPLTQDDFEIVDNATKEVVSSNQLQAGGDYTIQYTTDAQNTLKEDTNYTFGDFGTAKLTVTPRDITVTAPTLTKTYGESDPKFELTGVSSGELANKDQLSDLGVTLERVAGENVKAGPYTISADPASNLNKNYTITVTPGSLTINKKPVTVTANNVTATYNGSTPETNGFSVPDGALVGDDTPTNLGVTLDPISQVNAGTYPDAVTGTATSDNYNVTVVPGKLTIAQADSSVDLGAATMVYGDKFPTFTSTDNVPGTTSNITQADFEIVDTTGNTVGASKVQANGKYTLQLSQTAKNRLISENPNYAITFGTSTLTVTPRPVSVTAKNIDKTYGDADPDLELTDTSTGASTGLVAVDDLGVKLTRTSGESVGSYDITMDSSSKLNPNYAVTFTPGTFTINPADGNVAVTGTTMTYGDPLPSLSVSVNGAPASELSADNFEFVDTTTKSVVTAAKLPAGSYTVQLTKAAQDTLSKANGNFTLTFGTGTLTVNKRPITVKINDVTTDYDGSAHGANGFSISAGDKLVDGESSDELGVTLDPISETEIGTYTITGKSDSANYAVTVNNGTLKILGQTDDGKGNKTTTEKDAAGNVRIDKQWADGSETIYTDDNGKLTVTDKKGDKTLDQQTFNPAGDPLTLTDDPNTNTIVALDPTSKLPTFSHETTATNEAGDTTTTTDAEGNVVKVVKQWPDGTQTTYKSDPLNNGEQTVTEVKDGKTVDEKTFATDPKTGKPETTATVSNGDDIQTIVNVSEPGAVPTFEHDTTQTSKDDSGTVTATTKDDAGNIVKVVKTWPSDDNTTSTTTYTYDPSTNVQTVTEEKDGKQVDQKTLVADPTTKITAKATLNSGAAAQTIVNPVEPGQMPTFEHDTTVTSKDDSGTVTATTKDDAGNTVQVVKQWPDGTQTIYTDDNGTRTVTEKQGDKTLDQQTFNPAGDPLTLTDDANTNTIVALDPTSKLPTFSHETTKTDGDTTTTTDAEGNVVKAVKKWPDDTQTTYTYNPVTKAQTVTGEKDGSKQKSLVANPKPGTTDSTATVSNGDDIQTVVNVSKPGAAPTFEHDTTDTVTDNDITTATTKDDAGNVVKVVKTWPNDDNTTSTTTYTYDPGTKVQTVTEEKDGKQVDQATLVADPTTKITAKTTLKSGDAAQTIVNPVEPGQMPTFEHDTTDTVTDNDITTATTKDDAGNTVKVVKNWPDGTQTTYKLDPSTGKGDVSEQKNGKTIVDSQEIPADSHKVTITDDDKTSTIVTYDPTTKLATFEHDTTDTTTDDSGIVTTVTKDDAGNVIKVVKTWPKDNSTTTYTYDPTSSKAMITEVNNGKEIDRQEEVSSPSTTTLKSGDGVETIVNTGQPGDMPTFAHDTTVTVTDKLGNVTATTKNVAGDIVKVDQKWKDGSETIYTNDNGKQLVSELRNGKSVAQKPLEQQPVDPKNPDAPRVSEVTLSDGAGGTVTVKLDQPDAAPTFTHAPAVFSAGVNAPAKDADKVVKITKKWSDGLKVVYTYDPVSGQRIISELKNGKLIEQRAIEPGAVQAALPDGKGGSTIVKFDKTGTVPTFTRQLADKATSRKGTSGKKAVKKAVKKATANKGQNLRKQSAAVKPLAQSGTTHRGVNQAVAGDTVATEPVQSQQLTKEQQANQQETELPQTGQKNESFLAQLGAILLALLVTPFVRRRSH